MLQSSHRANGNRPSQQHTIIIGAGIGGLGLAAMLAKAGDKVTVVEKNEVLGGRARQFDQDGFTFDMGPSWYLMPDVFEHFFSLIGERVEDHLQLVKLSPSYRIFADHGTVIDLEADPEKAAGLFESIEPGAGEKLRRYLNASRYQYEVVMQNFLHKNFDTPFDFLTWRMLQAGTKLSAFTTMSRHVARFFKTPLLQKILQYQLLFLGSSPFKTSSIYNVMGHIDFNLGVYYPMGGIHRLIEALGSIAVKSGATIRKGENVARIVVNAGQVCGIELASGERIDGDAVVSNADIHHTETRLLEDSWRSFSARYWENRQLAPSALIVYMGISGRANSLLHHNILFNDDWEASFAELFEGREWPRNPSYYLCCPSKTDPAVAPENCETLFMLMPTAAKLDCSSAIVEDMAAQMIETVGRRLKVEGISERQLTSRIFSGDDFIRDYHSFGGSALGLAHSLTQTALFRPSNRSRKVRNLFYVGAGTNPGIGMPICLISAQLAYKRMRGIKASRPLASLSG